MSDVLGLGGEIGDRTQAVPVAGRGLMLAVIVPARNEAVGLADCLESLVGQSEPGFALGVQWELIVIDDASTDGTRAIAEGFVRPGVTVIEAPELDLSGAVGAEGTAGGVYGKKQCVLGGGRRRRLRTASRSGCCLPTRIRCMRREIFRGRCTRQGSMESRCCRIRHGRW